jgi:hypothetical protein
MTPKDAAAADTTTLDEPTQDVLFEFEGTAVEEQLVSLLGCSALEIGDLIEQGDECIIEVRGKAQQARIVTKQRGDRAGGREITRVVRVVKVDSAKLVRTFPKLVK